MDAVAGAVALGGGFGLVDVRVNWPQRLAIHAEVPTTLAFFLGILFSNFAPFALRVAPVDFKLAPVFWRKSCIAFLVGVFFAPACCGGCS